MSKLLDAPREIGAEQAGAAVLDADGVSSSGVTQAHNGAANRSNPMRLNDIIFTIALRWKVLLCALLLPCVLGLGAALLLKPKFSAEALLMVLVNRETTTAPDLSGFGPSVVTVEMLKVVRAEIEIMQSPATIRLALQHAGLNAIFPDTGLPTPSATPVEVEAEMEAAIEKFILNLHADTDTNTNLIRVSYTSPSRGISLAAVKALVDAYLERRSQVLQADGSGILASELARYEVQLRALETDIQRVRAQYGVLDITQEQQLATIRRDGTSQRLDNVGEQLAANLAQLSTAQALLTNEPMRVVSETDAASNGPNDDGRNVLARLLQERQHLASNYTPDYPPLRDLDLRIAAARQIVQDSARNQVSTTRQSRNPQFDSLSQRIAALNLERSALVEQRRALELQRQAAASRAEELRAAEVQLRDLQGRRDGLEVVVRQLTTREAGNRVAEEAGGLRNPSVRMVQSPVAPSKGRNIRRIVVAGGLMGGIMSAGGLALAFTLTRRNFVTPDEVERALALPCLGCFGSFGTTSRHSRTSNDAAIADLAAFLIDLGEHDDRLGAIQLVGTDLQDERRPFGRALVAELAPRFGNEVMLIDLEPSAQAASAGGNWASLIDPNVRFDAVRAQLTHLRANARAVVLLGPDNSTAYGSRRLSGLVNGNIVMVRAEMTQLAHVRAIVAQLAQSDAPILGFVFTGHRAILPQSVARWL